jgi:hypothetical protein
MDGWPDWDLITRDDQKPRPPFVAMDIVKGTDRPSRVIAAEWDDSASGLFYYRDWTDDGAASAVDGEVYHAGPRTDPKLFG